MATLELKIYKRNESGRREYDRTAKAETAFLPFGIVQDLITTVDIEALADVLTDKNKNTDELVQIALPAVASVMDEITPLLLDTFQDVSEDELRQCNTADIVQAVIHILVYSMKTMGKGSAPEKKLSTRKKNR